MFVVLVNIFVVVEVIVDSELRGPRGVEGGGVDFWAERGAEGEFGVHLGGLEECGFSEEVLGSTVLVGSRGDFSGYVRGRRV